MPEVCCQHWPYRRQASSHRYSVALEVVAVPVGATVLLNFKKLARSLWELACRR